MQDPGLTSLEGRLTINIWTHRLVCGVWRGSAWVRSAVGWASEGGGTGA